MSDRLLDAAELSELLNVSERWVREQTRSGAIPHVRLGRFVRFDLDDVLEWVETRKAPGRPTALRRARPVPASGTKSAQSRSQSQQPSGSRPEERRTP